MNALTGDGTGRLTGLPFGEIDGWLGYVTGVVDRCSIAILIVGAARFLIWMVRAELTSSGSEQRMERQNLARLELGRYILSGLELLIVADVIHTALSFSLDSIVFLGALALVRSVISWFLDREIASIEVKRSGEVPQ